MKKSKLNKSKITVSMPLDEYENLQLQENVSAEDALEANCDYISDLVDDVINGRVDKLEAKEFYFFQTKSGKYILENLVCIR